MITRSLQAAMAAVMIALTAHSAFSQCDCDVTFDQVTIDGIDGFFGEDISIDGDVAVVGAPGAQGLRGRIAIYSL